MTPEERIDAALDSVLRASGCKLTDYQHKYASEKRLADMRDAMRKIMSDSYISGCQPSFNEWFASLPEGRQAILREDKWMLAQAAFDAGRTT